MKSNLSSLSFLIGVFLLTSCGKGAHRELVNQQKNEQIYQQEVDEGKYRAILQPLAPELFGASEGILDIEIKGDHFIAAVNMHEVHSGIKHYQTILGHGSCPDLSDDMNGDGVIDINEALARAGKILIPLDSNVGSQLKGMDYGPIANNFGQYVYRRSTALSELLADLRFSDPDLTDAVVKLPFGMNLNLPGRVVFIHGVQGDTFLPESVGTVDAYSKDQILPVACGIIERVKTSGGESHQ